MKIENNDAKAYLVGGGIASLSAAVYLIQHGGIKGENIKIFDETGRAGGSLDVQDLSVSSGYVMRGIRMFEEEAFTCSFDLMSRIPSLTAGGQTLREEFVAFNQQNKCYSKSRLVRAQKAIDPRPLRLGLKDRLGLFTLMFRRETSLDNLAIRDYFSPAFFTSNFWYEFCTVFAFQPWHSLMEFRRYFIRFIQSFPKLDTLETIEIAPHNQYEFLVLPTVAWLQEQGVEFVVNTKITDLDFEKVGQSKFVSQLHFENQGKVGSIKVSKEDYAFITLGSIVSNTSIGSMRSPAVLNAQNKSAAWALWENIAKKDPQFGQPAIFNSRVSQSKWTSFTLTIRDPLFFQMIQKYVSRKVTAYGGINLVDSSWLISVVLSYNPYFLNQPENVDLCWGFGLFSDKEGDFVKKRMEDCSGEEILTELVHHLGFDEHLSEIIENTTCIPCTTPFITSHFLPRSLGDRPLVVPINSGNFAFLGQYCEIPEDVVFTVEYSVRSAQTAVYSLLGLDRQVTPIYKGYHSPANLWRALKTAFR